MHVEKTNIPGVMVITPRRFGDARGFFLEAWQKARYEEHGIDAEFVQDNQARSSRGVLRGMHFQVLRPQAQMVTVLRGHIYDVAVDLRPASPAFGKWIGAELNDTDICQIYTPPGVAHGYVVLSDVADLHYKVSRYYDQGDEGGLVWNDPDVGITWPAAPRAVLPRDAAFPRLRDIPLAMLPHDPPVEK